MKNITMSNLQKIYSALIFFFLFALSIHTWADAASINTQSISEQTDVSVSNTANASTSDKSNATVNVNSKNLSTITAMPKMNSTSQLASLIGGLVLILILIFGLSWFVKRFSQGGFMQNSTIRMLSAMPLGTRERLMLVDVGGKQLLLGVTATSINTLHVFEEPVVADAPKSSINGSDFSQKLMSILQQKNLLHPGDSSHKDSQR